MKLRSKETYWLSKHGLISTYPSLLHDVTCEVLVVGSGITGSLLAFQFSAKGFNTVLIDKRDIANGSTAATTAMLQYEIDIPLFRLIEKVGKDAAVDSYKAGVSAIGKIERIVKKTGAQCDFKKKRSLFLTASENDCDWLRKEFECRKNFHIDVSWLSEKQIEKRYGIMSAGAILSSVGASLDAYSLAHALITYSVRHQKLRVFDHSELREVVHGNGVNIVETDVGKRITCNYIIYATGYEASLMLKEPVVDLRSTYAFVSRPIKDVRASLRNTIFWNTENPYLYMRTTDNNRVLIGGADENFFDPVMRDSLIEKKKNYLLNKVRSIMPDTNLVPELAWAGTFGVTKDGLPYIGTHPGYPNSFFALGFGGNGITFSVMAMKILSDAIAGKPNKFLEHYRFGR